MNRDEKQPELFNESRTGQRIIGQRYGTCGTVNTGVNWKSCAPACNRPAGDGTKTTNASRIGR
jgi:hypothetical protein